MSVTEVPLRSDLPHFDLVQVLDGVSYLLTFHWNTRSEAWYLSLSLEDETPIWAGVKVVVGWPLFRRNKNLLAPPGFLMAFDDATLQRDPGLEDLGKRVRLLYFDASEVESLAAQAGE